MTVGDIDFTNNIIQVKDTKAGSRQAYMTEEIKNMLLDRLPAETKLPNLIFPNTQGGTLKRMDKIFKETVDEIGLNNGVDSKSQRAVFHSLRHTFASWLAINGTPLYTIKELMGHKTLTMTERYAHLIPDHKNQAVRDMAEIFRNAQTNKKTISLKEEVKHG
jgi:integrase